MTRLLRLFQIKTVRSAWMFLVGSGLMFLFGVYLIAMWPPAPPEDPRRLFDAAFWLVWFLITGAYMGIASWALFSAKGRDYLSIAERTPAKGNRTALWYLKFVFACYAAALASLMLLAVLAMPFMGYAGLEEVFSENLWLYLLIAGLAWSPLIFRHLK